MNALEALERVSLYEYRQGDTLIFRYPPRTQMSTAQRDEIAASVKRQLDDRVKILVVPTDWEIEVLRNKEQG